MYLRFSYLDGLNIQLDRYMNDLKSEHSDQSTELNKQTKA